MVIYYVVRAVCVNTFRIQFGCVRFFVPLVFDGLFSSVSVFVFLGRFFFYFFNIFQNAAFASILPNEAIFQTSATFPKERCPQSKRKKNILIIPNTRRKEEKKCQTCIGFSKSKHRLKYGRAFHQWHWLVEHFAKYFFHATAYPAHRPIIDCATFFYPFNAYMYNDNIKSKPSERLFQSQFQFIWTKLNEWDRKRAKKKWK